MKIAPKCFKFFIWQNIQKCQLFHCWDIRYCPGYVHKTFLHKTFTGEKSLVKSENSGKHEFTIDI